MTNKPNNELGQRVTEGMYGDPNFTWNYVKSPGGQEKNTLDQEYQAAKHFFRWTANKTISEPQR